MKLFVLECLESLCDVTNDLVQVSQLALGFKEVQYIYSLT